MKNDRIKLVLPYVGLPILIIALLITQIGRIELFFILTNVLLVIFGYIASVNDIKTKKIANSLVLAMLAGWVIIFISQLFFDIEGALRILGNAALGFATAGGLFFLVYIVSRKGLGGGDVKFMAVAGLYLGFGGVISAMLFGSIFAALVGLTLLLTKKIERKDTIPLAPFLYGGILITVFLG